MDKPQSSSSNNRDVSIVQGAGSQRVCVFCMDLSQHKPRLPSPPSFDKSGNLDLDKSFRTKAEVEQAARMGCIRCELISRALKIYAGSLDTDLFLYDNIKMPENGNAMGVQVVSRPITGSSKVLNLVFHVTSSRTISPEVCQPDVPVFEKSWLTTQLWQPTSKAWFLALREPLPIRSPAYLQPNTEEGDFVKPVFECSDSPAVFECIQAWLDKCNSEHESCRSIYKQHVPLPTRLLKVEHDDIRLIETTEGQHGEYVCLSHCWGGYQPIQTLLKNIEQHKKAIQWSCLPKTFQDAITIVRRTALSYLWIDSLCIIQDSLTDWPTEAARMADIYSRARFTIAALSAKNSKEGCFPIDDGKHNSHPLAKVKFEGKSASVFVRQDHGHPAGHFMSQNTVVGRGPAQPLLDRAWVFQERNLSPRIVYFGKTEILWECNTAGYCGCRPNIRRDPDRPARIQTKPWQKWQLMVNLYHELSLTFASDIFPALSGLANAFCSENQDLGRYLAGHWEVHLPRCLAWTTRKSRATGTDWRAPSWSWASVSQAMYDLRVLEPACSVSAIGCRHAGIDPYGALDAHNSSLNWIDLSGRVFPGTLTCIAGPDGHLQFDMKTTYGHGYFVGDLDFQTASSPDALRAGECLQLLCLHLGVSEDEEMGKADVFLTLRRFRDSGDFERVGLVRFYQRRGKIFPGGQLYSQEKATVRVR